MKRKAKILILFLVMALTACSSMHTPRYGENAPEYSVALLPWHANTVNFEYKYRWTMTQSLLKAAAQAGNFKIVSSAYYSYPEYGVKEQQIPEATADKLWVRHKYGKYMPDKETAVSLVKSAGADLGVFYEINADNGDFEDGDSTTAKADSVRIFLVDAANGTIVTSFKRTDFIRGLAYEDVKQLNLDAFDKFMSDQSASSDQTK